MAVNLVRIVHMAKGSDYRTQKSQKTLKIIKNSLNAGKISENQIRALKKLFKADKKILWKFLQTKDK